MMMEKENWMAGCKARRGIGLWSPLVRWLINAEIDGFIREGSSRLFIPAASEGDV